MTHSETCKFTVASCRSEPLVAEIVNVYAPGAVDLSTTMLAPADTDAFAGGVTGLGEMATLTPAGTLLALRVTGPSNPFIDETVTETKPDDDVVRLRDWGETVIEKGPACEIDVEDELVLVVDDD